MVIPLSAHNPLNYTLTAVDIAKGELKEHSDGLGETLEDIDQGMRRIRDIVSDLRSFAYPEQAGNHSHFDMAEAIKIALRLCAHELKDCKLVQEVQAPLMSYGSQNHIVQVLINLLTNASRATSRTDRPPEIVLAACDKSGRIRVIVRDNGVGIAKEALKNVFDPFYTTAEPGEGMGLGLSICHTIVRNHGGTIEVHSQQGDWTEVTFDLPLAVEEPA
jgi:signal transduction histidine kinase